MKTYERVCIKDFEPLKRGGIYLTSAEENGSVTVFTSQWIHGVPVDIFAGEIVFTEGQRGKWNVNGLDPEYLPTSQRRVPLAGHAEWCTATGEYETTGGVFCASCNRLLRK